MSIKKSKRRGLSKVQASSVVEALSDVCFDPVRELILLLPGIGKKDQADIILKLMEYVYPKKTALRFEAEINHRYQNLMVNIEDRSLIDMARGAIVEIENIEQGNTSKSDSGRVLAQGESELQVMASAGSDIREDTLE